jgi:Golgi SNAP receptor complex protein 2
MEFDSAYNGGRRDRRDADRDELFKRRANDDSTAIQMGYDEYIGREQVTLQSAHRNVDELLMNGGQIIGRLREQRDMLKGVRGRVLSIANALGLSNSVMNLIEKRSFEDKLILFGGMFLFLIFVIVVLIWVW